MAKPLTLESLKTKPKFELTLDKETQKINYVFAIN